jgi:hypothetical protein
MILEQNALGTKRFWDKSQYALLDVSGTKRYWDKTLLGQNAIGTISYLEQNAIEIKRYWDKTLLGQNTIETKRCKTTVRRPY